MKFWTAHSDDLVVDMVQCQECDKWIPPANMELHLLFHQKRDAEGEQDDGSLPAFVMETIPCEACHVLVPKGNWEIHSHVCRGRQDLSKKTPLENDPPPLLPNNDVPEMQAIECLECGILVPIHNLELHETRACRALYPPPILQEAPQREQPTGADEEVGWSVEENYEEWGCPRCTFVNQQVKDLDEDWNCTACGYSLIATLEEEETTTATNAKLEKKSNQFWKNLVETWVPKEYHQLLPEAMAPKQNSKAETKGKRSKRRRRTKPGHIPSQREVRRGRNYHLSLLERERQQYLQLLKTTRQEALALQEERPLLDDETAGRSDSHTSAAQVPTGNSSNQTTDAVTSGAPQHQTTTTQPLSSQLELLQATEQMCLYHLEHLRRTRLVQELALDVELLGLARWRHHLQHLCDLYESASETFVDNIIWELRMHFMQYATLEVIALLELKVWKEQIRAIVPLDTPMSAEARRACRNDLDISIICQSVLPFLGRPLTPALRAL